MIRKLFVTLLICFSFVVAYSQDGPWSRLRVYGDFRAQEAMARSGVDLDHLNARTKTYLIGEFSQWERNQIDRLGLGYDVLVADLQTYYRDRIAQSPPAKTADVNAAPDAFNLGSMGNFLTFAEAVLELDSMALNYPSLASVKSSIGTSGLGNPIWMVKISDNVNTDENEPEVLYDALHHAREPMSLMQLIYYMQYLLENYGTDAEVTYLVNNREMYFIPILNPDGYLYNQTTDPLGGGMWRKNRRDNLDGSYGVDINRNYAYNWAYDTIGSSPSTSSDRYCGPSAFSEPETQAMRDFCNSRQFKTALNYHSYGNLLIYPWGWEPNLFTPDSTLYETFADILTDENNYLSGTGNQTVGYVTNGSADDWMYGEQITKGKIMSLTPEVGSFDEGFWPQVQYILPWCELNLRPNLEIAWLAGQYIDATPTISQNYSGTNIFLPAEWTNAGLLTSTGASAVFVSSDPNITAINNSVNLPTLNTGDVAVDSFGITLAAGIADGTVITGIIRTTFDSFTVDDTISFIYGIPSMIFYEPAEPTAAAWNGGWNITTERAYAGTQSMTDSPMSPYAGNDFNFFTTDVPIDLSGFSHPRLRYWAQWDIETGWDYCQVLVSTNGGSWTALDGDYTHPGNGNQAFNEPLYDGVQNSWVEENIDLGFWAGQSVYLRFAMVSDGFVEQDGFYFDELEITGFPVGASAEPGEVMNDLYLFPSPARDKAWVHGGINTRGGSMTVEFVTLQGQIITTTLTGAGASVDLTQFPAGVYQYRFVYEGNQSRYRKLVIVK